MNYQQVIDFWFAPQHQALWFRKDSDFDNNIRQQFGDLWRSACRAELFTWRSSARGRLAEIIVLDQFSRNLSRDSAEAFRQDGMALVLSQELVASADWQTLSATEQGVALLPWMHSESAVIHQQAQTLFTALGIAAFLEFEIKHSEVIKRFGRYPHRNALLARQSTQEETDWMKVNPGF